MNLELSRLSPSVRVALVLCVCTITVFASAQDHQTDPAAATSATPVENSKPENKADWAGNSTEQTATIIDSSSRDSGQSATAQPGASGENSKGERPTKVQNPASSDFNQDIYYRNKLEFALDGGYFPINIPFPFDVFEGDPYELYPLRYTLVPVVVSIRWHIDSIGGRWIFRGNWDMTASFSATAIPRGAETHYFSYDMGVRRNFVRPNWKVAPYTDMRLGLGIINAKGPLGVYYAQGQNYTFTANLGAGVRYNFNSRYAISAGLNWMHISNNNLSAPEYSNYGINVYGPQFGLNIRLGRGRRHPSE
ncbi:MAG TPA: acyloxyacyl hydrolase [Candidatus Eisenbacteria bacterium]|nr:acyloxyacyl hydrolase [Candidatus Eisenbacteria bacterium]